MEDIFKTLGEILKPVKECDKCTSEEIQTFDGVNVCADCGYLQEIK